MAVPEYINIISQEAMYITPDWVAIVLLSIVAAITIIPVVIYCSIQKDITDKAMIIEIISGIIAIIVCFIFTPILANKFKVESGMYKYEATIDKTVITVAQYEEFIEKYRPEIKDGIYYFEAEGGLK